MESSRPSWVLRVQMPAEEQPTLTETTVRQWPGCARPGCGQAPSAHIGWALRHLYDRGTEQTPAEEQPTRAEATAESHCAKCSSPFTHRGRHGNGPYCDYCVYQCRQNQNRIHLCMICR